MNILLIQKIKTFLFDRKLRHDLEKKWFAPVHQLTHGGVNFAFYSPNAICEYRNKTFSTKEPDTLSWIDGFNRNSIFWDVGANVGLYSIYAAKKMGCSVISFEPSVFNLEILTRNIYLNGLHEHITVAPIALCNNVCQSMLKLTTEAAGGALSTFGENFDGDGEPIQNIFEYKTLGMTLDQFHKVFNSPMPDYIKIDVDGLEHFILWGAEYVLTCAKAVLVEINENFLEQAEQASIALTKAGLICKNRFDIGSGGYSNQLWTKL